MPAILSFLPYLQRWDGTQLSLRLLLIPQGSPLDPLDPATTPPVPPFATAGFAFDVRLVAGLDALPTLQTSGSSVVLKPAPPPSAKALFQALAGQFPIGPASPAVRPPGTRVKKHAPQTYRDAAGFSGGRT